VKIRNATGATVNIIIQLEVWLNAESMSDPGKTKPAPDWWTVRKHWDSLLDTSTNTAVLVWLRIRSCAQIQRVAPPFFPSPTDQDAAHFHYWKHNIWLPDFCPQPSQMSLKPTFICCATNQHAKICSRLISERPSGLWHRGQAKQTAVTSLFSCCQRGNARDSGNKQKQRKMGHFI